MNTEDIKLTSRFAEIFGATADEYTEEERKARWEKWKSLVPKKDVDFIKQWEDQESCQGCMHLDTKTSWCNKEGLLCTINPILTYQYGFVGMACIGAGKELIQQSLFEKKPFEDLPF